MLDDGTSVVYFGTLDAARRPSAPSSNHQNTARSAETMQGGTRSWLVPAGSEDHVSFVRLDLAMTDQTPGIAGQVDTITREWDPNRCTI